MTTSAAAVLVRRVRADLKPALASFARFCEPHALHHDNDVKIVETGKTRTHSHAKLGNSALLQTNRCD